MENNALYRLLVKSWELIFAKLHVKIDNFPKIKFQFTKRWFLDLTTLPARISKYHFEPLLSVLNPTENHMICLPFLFSFFFFFNKHSHFCLFFKLIIYLIPFFSFLAAEPDSYWSGDHCVIIMFISFSGDSLIHYY